MIIHTEKKYAIVSIIHNATSYHASLACQRKSRKRTERKQTIHELQLRQMTYAEVAGEGGSWWLTPSDIVRKLFARSGLQVVAASWPGATWGGGGGRSWLGQGACSLGKFIEYSLELPRFSET